MRRRLVIACAIASLALGAGWQTAAFAGGGSQGGNGQGSNGGGNPCSQGQNGNDWNNQCCTTSTTWSNGNKQGNGNGNQGNGGSYGCHYGPHAPSLQTSTSTSSPGGTVGVTGKGFDPTEVVTLSLDCPYAAPVGLGTTSTNGAGMFSTTVTIPSGTKAGQCTIVGTGAKGDSASTAITVKVVKGHPTSHHGRHHHGKGWNSHDHSHKGSKH